MMHDDHETVRADAAETPEEKRAREVEEQLRAGDRQKADEERDKTLKTLADAVTHLCSRMDAWEEEKKADAKRRADEEERKKAEGARRRHDTAHHEDDDADEDDDTLLNEEEHALRAKGEAVPVAADEMRKRRAGAKLDPQARADEVASMHGLRAPAPMVGEKLRAYRRRCSANSCRCHQRTNTSTSRRSPTARSSTSRRRRSSPTREATAHGYQRLRERCGPSPGAWKAATL
jgi:hypothetical protein